MRYVRGLFDPSFVFQTGSWISGSPGSGKSTFLSWLQAIFTTSCVELSCSKVNMFERFHLFAKSIILISDKKFQTISDSFRSNAVLFVTSNLECFIFGIPYVFRASVFYRSRVSTKDEAIFKKSGFIM